MWKWSKEPFGKIIELNKQLIQSQSCYKGLPEDSDSKK